MMMRLTLAHFALSATFALAPAASRAQHVRPSAVAPAVSAAATQADRSAARLSSVTAIPAAFERNRASAARHAGIGAVAGLVAGTAVVVAIGYTYGTGYSSVPVVVIGVVTAGGAAVGALSGLAVYGVKRLARRD
jgi:hypothetical protein